MNTEKHNKDYKKNGNAWDDYSLHELEMWVNNLRKRSGMRTDEEKAEKDNYDADNYEEFYFNKLVEEIEKIWPRIKDRNQFEDKFDHPLFELGWKEGREVAKAELESLK